ncbi:MAG: PaaI family thioesterase [Chloroflexi bacterium]|jgi:acyl-coenzyme A thioesterase PaaI-like protein|nr:PaaI family thioesterase [Chloroflexota bacterium]
MLIGYPADAALQDVWQNATCYGCGPANRRGLHIKSYWDAANGEGYCTFIAQPYHNAGFENVLYGGLVASLCDCHSTWTAIAYTYIQEGRPFGAPPAISYVTANLNVTFLAPTPLLQPITLRARVEELVGRKAIVFCYVHDGTRRTAEARVTAVRIAADKSVGYAEGRG